MISFNFCPKCGIEIKHDDVECKNCGHVLDKVAFDEAKEKLQRIIDTGHLFAILPASIEKMTYAQVMDALSVQLMIESDMNTSSDFNPEGTKDYHEHK